MGSTVDEDVMLAIRDDKWTLVSPVHYDDKSDTYYLVHTAAKYTRPDYKERIPRQVVEKLIKDGRVELKERRSNWKIYGLRNI